MWSGDSPDKYPRSETDGVMSSRDSLSKTKSWYLTVVGPCTPVKLYETLVLVTKREDTAAASSPVPQPGMVPFRRPPAGIDWVSASYSNLVSF